MSFSSRLKNSNLNWFHIGLVILLVAGFYLRIYNLGEQSIWIDESYSITAAKGMMENLVPHFPTGAKYSRAILNTFLIAVSMFLFGVNEFAARLPSVIFGTATIIITYFFTKEFFDRKTALLAAFFVTFSSLQIAWSRQARMYQQLQFFYISGLFLFHRYIKTKEHLFGFLSIISAVLATLSHRLGFLLFGLMTLYLIFDSIKNIDISSLNYNILTNLFVFVLLLLLSYWFANHINAWNALNLSDENQFFDYHSFFLSNFSIIYYLFVFGISMSLINKNRQIFWPIISFAIPFYLVSFHHSNLGFRYLFLTFPIMFVFAARTITYVLDQLDIYDRFSNKNKNRNQYQFKSQNSVSVPFVPILIIITMITSTFILPSLNLEPKSKYYLGVRAPQPDFKSIYSFLDAHKKENDILISSYPEISVWYSNSPDYWTTFEIGNTGIDGWINKDRTHYSRIHIPLIKNSTELQKIYKNNDRGWIVIDFLAKKRLSGTKRLNFIQNKTTLKKNVSDTKSAWNIYLYHWNKNST